MIQPQDSFGIFWQFHSKKLNVHTGHATHSITHYILRFKRTDFVSASVILQSAAVTNEDSELPIYVFIV